VLAEARAGLRGEIGGAEGEGDRHNRMHFGQRRLRHEGMEGGPQGQRGSPPVI